MKSQKRQSKFKIHDIVCYYGDDTARDGRVTDFHQTKDSYYIKFKDSSEVLLIEERFLALVKRPFFSLKRLFS